MEHEENNKTQDKEKVLFIGSSLLQGIKLKGLAKNVTIRTLRGAHINDDVENELLRMSPLNQFDRIIFQVGTNDCSSGSTME